MKYFTILILVYLNSFNSFGQNWISVKNTTIKYSNLQNDTTRTWGNKYLEYFEKNDSIIGIVKDHGGDFYDVFSKFPIVFTDIIANAHSVNDPIDYNDVHTLCYDSIITKRKYKAFVLIAGLSIIDKSSSQKWNLTIMSCFPLPQKCSVELQFKAASHKRETYIGTYFQSCEE